MVQEHLSQGDLTVAEALEGMAEALDSLAPCRNVARDLDAPRGIPEPTLYALGNLKPIGRQPR